MNNHLKKLTALLLLVLVLLPACSSHRRIPPAEGKNHQLSQERRLAVLRKKVNPLLKKKHYRRALELVCERHQANQPLDGMEKEYIAAVNGLLEIGEDAMSSSDYGFAGQNFRTVLDAYPAESKLVGKIKSSEKVLKAHLETCSNELMEQGLEQYRRGELEKAIKTWKTIIAFSADHKGAEKAIATATVQEKSLNEMTVN